MKSVFFGLLIAGFTAVSFAGVASADAYTKAIRASCKQDYKRHCSDKTIGSKQLEVCMRQKRNSLSKTCQSALKAAGYR
ncbi:hypothetical protein [Methyloceanibacter sp. wino2]|uniref:hypothetical protein n=1 Tax=Methyloceanibacter sp. wino2 TaxID=2170729 RepID=UPI000D3ECAF5|nr:hypothetical protein [Methyloceanibacter sp. wino2]